jgi:hypothetical protein
MYPIIKGRLLRKAKIVIKRTRMRKSLSNLLKMSIRSISEKIKSLRLKVGFSKLKNIDNDKIHLLLNDEEEEKISHKQGVFHKTRSPSRKYTTQNPRLPQNQYPSTISKFTNQEKSFHATLSNRSNTSTILENLMNFQDNSRMPPKPLPKNNFINRSLNAGERPNLVENDLIPEESD